MAVSQISMSDTDITGHAQSSNHANREVKPEVNKKLESQKSVGMDDLMNNLTSSNAKPAGKK